MVSLDTGIRGVRGVLLRPPALYTGVRCSPDSDSGHTVRTSSVRCPVHVGILMLGEIVSRWKSQVAGNLRW